MKMPSGTLTIAASAVGASEVSDNTLDFADFENTLDLDAALTVNADSGETITVDRVIGHRDTNSTECPGAALYAQLTELRSLGCDGAQGFLFSRPLPPAGRSGISFLETLVPVDGAPEPLTLSGLSALLGPGRLVVAAAGNEGGSGYHARQIFTTGADSVVFTLEVPSYSPDPQAVETFLESVGIISRYWLLLNLAP